MTTNAHPPAESLACDSCTCSAPPIQVHTQAPAVVWWCMGYQGKGCSGILAHVDALEVPRRDKSSICTML
eukprot:8077608-Alexandrium_andersonii.AAC.1